MKIKNVLLIMTIVMSSTMISWGNVEHLSKIEYIVEKEKVLSLECWMVNDTVWVTDVNKGQKEKLNYHENKRGKHKGKNDCDKKECKKDCPNKKEFSKEKGFEKRDKFRKEFSRPIFHENDSIKFEHSKR